MTVTNPKRASVPPTQIEQFDLVVLGAGPAGSAAAAEAAALGKSVAMVEMSHGPGGTAVHSGTLPSKILRETALAIVSPRARRLEGLVVELAQGATVETLQSPAAGIAAAEVARIRTDLERHGVRYYEGKARFEDAFTLRIQREAESSVFVRGRHFLVATGSKPLRSRIVPFESSRVHDTDGIVHLGEIPPTLVILGAGARGCELACTFAALGSKVTLVDARARILPYLDGELVERLVGAMQRMGITFLPGMKWGAIHAFEDLVTVDLADGRTLDTDHLLYAAGRVGNSWDIGLERIGIMPDGRGYIPVDDAFRTEVEHILAAGDVIGPPTLPSTSMAQGRLAARRAFGGKPPTAAATTFPYGVHSIPELCSLGETEDSAAAKGLDVVVGRAPFAECIRGLVTGDVDGMTKLVVDRSTRKLLGVHVIGERATALVHIGGTAMAAGATVDLFLEMAFNHPTLAESYRRAAEEALTAIAKG